MTSFWWVLLGLLCGWLIELAIDYTWWRKRHQAAAEETARRIGEIEQLRKELDSREARLALRERDAGERETVQSGRDADLLLQAKRVDERGESILRTEQRLDSRRVDLEKQAALFAERDRASIERMNLARAAETRAAEHQTRLEAADVEAAKRDAMLASRESGIKRWEQRVLSKEKELHGLEAEAARAARDAERWRRQYHGMRALIDQRYRRDDGADDLTVIEGIDDRAEALLHRHGIDSFARLAETPLGELSRLAEAAGPGLALVDPMSWAEQAALLVERDFIGFESLGARLRGDIVPSEVIAAADIPLESGPPVVDAGESVDAGAGVDAGASVDAGGGVGGAAATIDASADFDRVSTFDAAPSPGRGAEGPEADDIERDGPVRAGLVQADADVGVDADGDVDADAGVDTSDVGDVEVGVADVTYVGAGDVDAGDVGASAVDATDFEASAVEASAVDATDPDAGAAAFAATAESGPEAGQGDAGAPTTELDSARAWSAGLDPSRLASRSPRAEAEQPGVESIDEIGSVVSAIAASKSEPAFPLAADSDPGEADGAEGEPASPDETGRLAANTRPPTLEAAAKLEAAAELDEVARFEAGPRIDAHSVASDRADANAVEGAVASARAGLGGARPDPAPAPAPRVADVGPAPARSGKDDASGTAGSRKPSRGKGSARARSRGATGSANLDDTLAPAAVPAAGSPSAGAAMRTTGRRGGTAGAAGATDATGATRASGVSGVSGAASASDDRAGSLADADEGGRGDRDERELAMAAHDDGDATAGAAPGGGDAARAGGSGSAESASRSPFTRQPNTRAGGRRRRR